MSFTFSIGYRTPINSSILNKKFQDIWGRNGVLSGLDISKHSDTQVKINSGVCIIQGVNIKYTEDNAGNPLRVTIPSGADGNVYIYGIYNHKLSAFTIHATLNKEDTQGEWKIFLGHAVSSSGSITSVQPIVDPSNAGIENIYKRIPTLNEIINLFYETTIEVNGQINILLKGIIGDMSTLKTKHKSTVVGSINELFDTKEPTLTRDRIFELIGGGSGGNIDIDSINNIPISKFVLADRAIKTPSTSGLTGGGNLSQDRTLNINWGSGSNQVPRGNHNHTGYHLDKKYSSNFGSDSSAAVYSHLAYFARNDAYTGILKITLPNGFTGANMSIELRGYDANVANSSYTLQLGGILAKSSKAWLSCTANMLGTAPFSKVTFGMDEIGRPCILLGTISTPWNKGCLFVDKVLVSGDSVSSWQDGWQIELTDTSAGIRFDKVPTIKTGGPQTGEYVVSARSVSAGTGLTGGGTLAKDITLSVNFGTTSTTVAKGNHTHSNYLNKQMSKAKGVLITDSNGNIVTSSTLNTTELNTLSGIKSNIQNQLDKKSPTGHSHSSYVPFTGGNMKGSLYFGDTVNEKLSAHYLYIRGYRLTIGGLEPSVKSKGTIWIDLPSL